MRKRRTAPGGGMSSHRHRNLQRQRLRRRKFLQHRQREQRVGLENYSDADTPERDDSH